MSFGFYQLITELLSVDRVACIQYKNDAELMFTTAVLVAIKGLHEKM